MIDRKKFFDLREGSKGVFLARLMQRFDNFAFVSGVLA